MKHTLEILLLVTIGMGIGYILLGYPPEPPPGVCDADGTPEACRDWWHDITERP